MRNGVWEGLGPSSAPQGSCRHHLGWWISTLSFSVFPSVKWAWSHPDLPSQAGGRQTWSSRVGPDKVGLSLEIIPAGSEGSAVTNKAICMRRALPRKSGSAKRRHLEVSRARPFWRCQTRKHEPLKSQWCPWTGHQQEAERCHDRS